MTESGPSKCLGFITEELRDDAIERTPVWMLRSLNRSVVLEEPGVAGRQCDLRCSEWHQAIHKVSSDQWANIK